ncbi:flagellar basal body P-ring protein FlgI [Agrobacterium rosae]|uniref:Flagellar P-ring protein n=1 Tax=Agrobacterium rosae TaxID=1972867 RepID=A0AAE5VPH1_9HYPH|nr:flagellar basal body P-ring protein FlgI [Agrobacterium rosae]KAA3514597.1 flagellar basal body P-ring protein FlgI [Agrobacterium rosae]KAA3523260.1 flagellar basal body P-ring protein FlgI [Agrobacterium rosae]MDX8330463.1 flagellar basal body P-ring protein FlgI [Agrobacterium rosae]MQB47422.1 flagellar basal body P-ring protein FlgI [Agrobacterium rosae]POO51640.1 flagellar biosynthesis protein FlgI [Agrobacterium rosae]
MIATFLVTAPAAYSQFNARVKDIASLQAGRENQLIGYGLVVGLQGSGDSMRSSPFTEQSMRAMLQNLGISMQGNQSGSKNVAAVMVTANLPPFASPGSRLDVNVSSLGDASSLRGGTLIMTSMSGADGQIYAVAQGSVIVSGFNAEGQAAQLTQGVTTAGRVPSGAIIERELPSQFKDSVNLVLQLRNPDFSTSTRIADAINGYARTAFGEPIAEARDSQVVFIQKPRTADLTRLMASIENLSVETDTPAKVVINERTGTIVIGADVRISQVAVSYGTLTVQVTETPQVIQPQPFSRGETAVQPQTDIAAQQTGGPVAILNGPNLRSLVAGLNNIGVKPDGIIAILQGIKSAGALQAELVLQ